MLPPMSTFKNHLALPIGPTPGPPPASVTKIIQVTTHAHCRKSLALPKGPPIPRSTTNFCFQGLPCPKVHPFKLLNERDNSCDLDHPEVMLPPMSATKATWPYPKAPPPCFPQNPDPPPTTTKIHGPSPPNRIMKEQFP